MTYDTIIIGKGPAGISAGIYLARAGKSTLVLGKETGALERAETIENYYGFPEPVSGAELARRGIAQAERLGVEIRTEEAVNIAIEDAFVVRTSDGEYRARSILIATGKSRSGLKVPGFEELRGKGISFCATCDGFFYRKKRLAVVGSGEYAASEFHELLHVTDDVTVFTNGSPMRSDLFPEEVSVVAGKIARFSGTERLSEIVTEDGVAYPVDGAFIAIGTAGAADFAAKIGIALNGSDIAVDGCLMTNVPGIFAAGDCVGGLYQVAKAVSDGATAAKAIIAFLKN
jgi:thioredoxin reductase (NADPH)